MATKNRLMVVFLLAGLVAAFHPDDCRAQSSGGSSGSSGDGGVSGQGGSSGGDGAASSSDASVGAAEGAGDGSGAGAGDGRGPLEKVNRHAIKSMVLVRQLLAQSNINLPAAK